jgi:DNA-binding transcriptional LysR family regulator
LAPLLQEATDRLALAIDRRGFIATETTRTFTIALSDNYQACDVPHIAHAFAASMPQATLRVVSSDYLAASDGLASGDIDVAFSPEQAVQPGMRSTALFEEQAALIVRRDHPHVHTRMIRELSNKLPHIDIHVVLGQPGTGHRVAQRGANEPTRTRARSYFGTS